MSDQDEHPPPQEAGEVPHAWDGMQSPALTPENDDGPDDRLDDELADAVLGSMAEQPADPSSLPPATHPVDWTAGEANEARRAHARLHAAPRTELDRNRAGAILFRAYWPRFLRLASRRHRLLNRADVEELLSSTVYAFLTYCPANCAEPEAWLYCVFSRLACSRWRRESAACRNGGVAPLSLDATTSTDGRPLHEVLSDGGQGDPVHALQEQQLAALMADVLAEVATRSSNERAAVLLLAIKGNTCVEIATKMGKSPGAVRDQLMRARRVMQAILKERQA